ncbi:hypothetical protein [Noviherbaspirillum aerium]|uniref:hypothetical protein n=1 Tax=Noviherbaspirillum aerium TaxID=2588497 RepID=UPI00124F1396|nr:hypothetical protein [Noviherbaspirillum aerium]
MQVVFVRSLNFILFSAVHSILLPLMPVISWLPLPGVIARAWLPGMLRRLDWTTDPTFHSSMKRQNHGAMIEAGT